MNKLKYYKAITPSLRHKIGLTVPLAPAIANKSLLLKAELQNKKLSIIRKAKAGRNFSGKITVRHRGHGHKRRIRIIDNYHASGRYSLSKLINIVYDPNKSNYLALYKTGSDKWFFKHLIDGQKIGDKIHGLYYPLKKEFHLGDAMPLKDIPVGTKISNLELKRGGGIKLAKAAGVFVTPIKHDTSTTRIKLNKDTIVDLSSNCLATIGRNSNIKHNQIILGKAGVNRWRGIRPTVRGEAMNPVDHPHGGKTSGGVRLKTVYGKLAKFIKTAK